MMSDGQFQSVISTEPESIYPPLKTSDCTIWYVVVPIVLAVIAMIIIIFVALVLRTEDSDYKPCEEEENKANNTAPQTAQEVFLIYAQDCGPHVEAVKAFADALEKCLHCNVSYYDLKELHEIMTNKHSWFHQVRVKKKILIISSEGAFLQQKAWLENKDLDTSSEDYFLSLLEQLTLKQRRNYGDVVNVRFHYTSKEFLVIDVVPECHYEVPKDVESLINILLDGRQRTQDVTNVFKNFCEASENCRIFLDDNPDYIRTSLQPHDSRTTMDDDQPPDDISLQYLTNSSEEHVQLELLNSKRQQFH